MCPIVWLKATGGRSFDAAEVTWGVAVCAGSDLRVRDGDSWYPLEWGESGLWSAGRFPAIGPGGSWSGLVSSAFSAKAAKQNIRVLAFKNDEEDFPLLRWSRTSSVTSEKMNKKLSVKAHPCHPSTCEACNRTRQEGQELKANLGSTGKVCLDRIRSWRVAQWENVCLACTSPPVQSLAPHQKEDGENLPICTPDSHPHLPACASVYVPPSEECYGKRF